MNAPFSHMRPGAPQVVLFTPGMRRLTADAIESLILLLDEIDGDPDLEDDAEEEHDGREPDADYEQRFVPAFEAGCARIPQWKSASMITTSYSRFLGPPAKASGGFIRASRVRASGPWQQ